MRTTIHILTMFLALTGVLSLASCGPDTDPAPQVTVADKSRHLQIRMHDFPLLDHDIEKVVVDIREIQVHHTEKGWLTVSSEPRKYDLLELQNGITALIFDQPLEIGSYTQIRLELNQHNEVFVKGQPYRLTVPSGEETGVKLITPFEIKEGKMVEVTLDFDAQRSVQLVKGQGFKLKPVIKVERIAEYDGVGLVTPDGGVINSLDGDFTLMVPAGAVTESIVVSMTKVDISQYPLPDSDITLVGNAYDLAPNGYQFSTPVNLQVSYTDDEISSLGDQENLKLFTFNKNENKWEVVPSTVVPSVNVVNGELAHFSTYAVGILSTCADGVRNSNETGVDCGGSCTAVCVDCNDYAVLNGANPTGSGPMADVYSFGNTAVKQAADQAKSEYAAYLTTPTHTVNASDINTPDLKIEAVSRYVNRHMAWMEDEGDVNWDQVFTMYMPLSSFGLGDLNPVNNHVRRTWFCPMPPRGGHAYRPFREGAPSGSNCNCS
jgi:hypothetical protein